MNQSTKTAFGSLSSPARRTPTARAGNIPLPRRWARAKSWSAARCAGPPDIQHIKLMLLAERANRG